jgi:hypothetical protein
MNPLSVARVFHLHLLKSNLLTGGCQVILKENSTFFVSSS